MPSQTMGFADLLEAVPDALVGVDRSGVIRFVNHRAESMFGYEPGDLVGAPLETLVPESVRQVHAAHRKGFNSAPRTRPMGTDLKLRGRRADGSDFPVDIALSCTDPGEAMVVLAAVRDMTNHKKAHREREREGRLSAVVEFSGEAIISATPDGVITSWNPAAERLYGYSSAQIVGKPIASLTTHDATGELTALLDKVDAGGTVENYEIYGLRRDATVFPASLTVSPICEADGTVIGSTTIARDVTEQRKAFAAAQLMAAVIEFSGDAIITSTLDGVITSWNPAAERLYGYPCAEIVGTRSSALSPQDRNRELDDALARIAAGASAESLQTVGVRKDATVFPIFLTLSSIRDKNGVVVGASAIARDVTEQRKSFDAARSMIEASLDSLVAISPEGKITDANQATVKVTGVSRTELIGTPFSDYFTYPKKAEEIYQKVFTEGKAVNYALTLRHRNGTLTEVLFNASVYRDAGGNVLGVFAAARDVTKQLQAQRQAARQQTRELQRLAELERFQRLTVGRELKMIELKKEIEYLRKSGPAMGGKPDDQR
jgi:PAS domain S-box-containing protein